MHANTNKNVDKGEGFQGQFLVSRFCNQVDCDKDRRMVLKKIFQKQKR